MTATQEQVDRLFDEWRVLRDRAWQTADMSDALAAGKAWGRYMRAFEKFTEDEASSLVPGESKVVAFKRRPGHPPRPPDGGSAA